jgi:hypothetical protein
VHHIFYCLLSFANCSAWKGYLQFYEAALEKEGQNVLLEKYILSLEFNSGDKNPLMLARFMGNMFHSLIHTGYGCEFKIPGTLIEGKCASSVFRCQLFLTLP